MKGSFLALAFCLSLVTNAEPVAVVTGDSYFPFISDDLPEKGWSNAVIKAVFAQMGEELVIEVVPWSRGFKWALENKYLGTYPYVYSDVRNESFLYSDPINYISVKLFVAQDSSITKLADLESKRMCLPIGYTISDTIGSLKQKYSLKINRAADNKGCFGHVEKGWSDVGLINDHISKGRIRQIYDVTGEFRILPEVYDTIPLYFIISRTYPEASIQLERFNQALAETKENGVLETIRERYMKVLADD